MYVVLRQRSRSGVHVSEPLSQSGPEVIKHSRSANVGDLLVLNRQRI